MLKILEYIYVCQIDIYVYMYVYKYVSIYAGVYVLIYMYIATSLFSCCSKPVWLGV